MAEEALRTLSVAFRSLPIDALEGDSFHEGVERDLVFLGLTGMIDPPRQEARDAVRRASGAGIRSIMITGDHPKTAAIIVAELRIGSGQRAVSGAELQAMSDEDLDRMPEVDHAEAQIQSGVQGRGDQAWQGARSICGTSRP